MYIFVYSPMGMTMSDYSVEDWARNILSKSIQANRNLRIPIAQIDLFMVALSIATELGIHEQVAIEINGEILTVNRYGATSKPIPRAPASIAAQKIMEFARRKRNEN